VLPWHMRSTQEQRDEGKALREATPIGSLADLRLPLNRPSALSILQGQDTYRVQRLLPIRYGRMSADSFAYFRGSAAVMAADLAAGERTATLVQLCGDAHLANFGLFQSPERRLVFDINDFDETLPGPFEWDVKRLVASCALVRPGQSKSHGRALIHETATAYCQAIKRASEVSPLEMWYYRLDYDDMVALRKNNRKDKTREHANLRTNLGAMNKLTERIDGHHQIKTRWPLVTRLDEEQAVVAREQYDKLWGGYLDSLPPNRRTLLSRYTIEDMAMKVVGVGSVGTRCWIILLLSGDGDPLFLQLKEASPSVLEKHLGKSQYRKAGQRVVLGQEEIQAASDVFLGWASTTRQGAAKGTPIDYYFRQLWDGKFSPTLAMPESVLRDYARLCAIALARAHARSGLAGVLHGYLGDGQEFAQAMTTYALAYADVAKMDHTELLDAVARGDVEAQPGI